MSIFKTIFLWTLGIQIVQAQFEYRHSPFDHHVTTDRAGGLVRGYDVGELDELDGFPLRIAIISNCNSRHLGYKKLDIPLFSSYVFKVRNNLYQCKTPSGGLLYFQKLSNGSWLSPNRRYSLVSSPSDGSITISADGWILQYGEHGELQKMTTPKGMEAEFRKDKKSNYILSKEVKVLELKRGTNKDSLIHGSITFDLSKKKITNTLSKVTDIRGENFRLKMSDRSKDSLREIRLNDERYILAIHEETGLWRVIQDWKFKYEYNDETESNGADYSIARHDLKGGFYDQVTYSREKGAREYSNKFGIQKEIKFNMQFGHLYFTPISMEIKNSEEKFALKSIFDSKGSIIRRHGFLGSEITKNTRGGAAKYFNSEGVAYYQTKKGKGYEMGDYLQIEGGNKRVIYDQKKETVITRENNKVSIDDITINIL